MHEIISRVIKREYAEVYGNVPMTTAEFVELGEAIASATKLRGFAILDDTVFGTELRVILVGIGRNKSLSLVRMWNIDLADEDAFAFARAIAENKTIIHVCLRGINVSERGLCAIIKAVAGNKNIVKFSLRSFLLNDTILGELALLITRSRVPLLVLVFSGEIGYTPAGINTLTRAIEVGRTGLRLHYSRTLQLQPAMDRAVINRIMIELMSASVARRVPEKDIWGKLLAMITDTNFQPPPSPLARFLSKDGDCALTYRVMQFLLEAG